MLRRLCALAVIITALPVVAATRYFTEQTGSPVKWQSWGTAAIERARREQRPIFLSVGLAASFECFTMQHDAFANAENARLLNAYFVPVLVDPVEYPEIAEASEAMLRPLSVGSGWPANLILTPSLEPFAGGSFMTKEELSRLLVLNANRWSSEKETVIGEGRANLARARAAGEPHSPADVDQAVMELVRESVVARYGAKKSIDASSAAFLFSYAARTKNDNLRSTVIDALRRKAASPLRDQIGGGFHRCPTCFEKMLPDQALEALAYLEASRLANDADLANVARTTLDYALRDLRLPGSPLFEASQDAHSLVPQEKPVFAEGAFYLWRNDEITRLVGPDAAGKIFQLYGMKADAANRPALADPRFLHETFDGLAQPLAVLHETRQKRPAPFREPASVAGWNGLMISALARAGTLLSEPAYVEAAAHAAAAVQTRFWNAQKKSLVRTESGAPATSGDYALLIDGLLELFSATSDVRWLDFAMVLHERQDRLFWDASAGRYASGGTLPDAWRGLLREDDGDLPSVNAVSAENLQRLAALVGGESFRTRPSMIFDSFGGRFRTGGADLPQLAHAYELSLLTPHVVVVTGDPRKKETVEMLLEEREVGEPLRTVIFVPDSPKERERVEKTLPFTRGLVPDADHPVAYLCSGGQCRRR